MKRSATLVVLGLVVLLPSPRFAVRAGGPLESPSLEHWFGTDDLGRDLAAGVIEGTRLSLLVGLGTVLLALVLGASIGIAAGLLEGLWDEILMRGVEVFQVVPRFFLSLVVLTIWGYHLWLLVLVLGLTSWSGLARLARAETLTIKEREFVVAARAGGARFSWLFLRHVLPQAVRPLVATAPLTMGGAMLTEAGLSFLGLGSLQRVSWGYLLRNAQPFLLDAWWMSVFPGLAMTITVFSVALFAFGADGDAGRALRAQRS
ncbi:MAG TPA: ABC transporter permease [Vicinamibacteria bacterium]|nr:ABC transporter permease [Vicinamibacteria bacterium]